MRILLIDDSLEAIRTLGTVIKNAGLSFDSADTAAEGAELFRLYRYDLIVTEIELPDSGAVDIIRSIRSLSSDVPILVLSKLSAPRIKVQAFAVGADDFLTKPFDHQEILARIGALHRRRKRYVEPSISIANLEIFLGTRSVEVDRRPIHLTGKEYAILELLALRRNVVLTKEAILNHLYAGIDEPDVRIVDVFITKLRKKLLGAGANVVIGKVWGRGYILHDRVNSGERTNASTVLPADRKYAG